MATNTVQLGIDVLVKDATKAIEGFEKNTSSSLKSIQSGFNMLKAAAVAAVGFVAGRELIRGIEAVTEAAAEEQKNIQKLNTALAISGEYSLAASRDMRAFAESIKETTTYDDDAIVSVLTLAKSFGLTNEQAKLATKAAVEFAAATGKDLDSSITAVAASFNGMTKGIAKYSPEIKKLTQAQLEAGGAAEILIKNLGGSAAGQLNTFDGALTQVSKSFDDFKKALGRVIVDNPIFMGIMKTFGDIFKELAKSVDENKSSIIKFFNDFAIQSAKAIPVIINSLSYLVNIVAGVRISFIVLKAAMLDLAVFLVESFPNIINTVVKSLLGLGLVLVDVAKTVAFLTGKLTNMEAIQGVAEALEGLSLTYKEAIDNQTTENMVANLKSLQDAANKTLADSTILDDAAEINKAIAKTANVFEKELNKIAAKANTAGAAIRNIPKEIEEIPKSFTIGVLIDAALNPQTYVDMYDATVEALKTAWDDAGEYINPDNIVDSFKSAGEQITQGLTDAWDYIRSINLGDMGTSQLQTETTADPNADPNADEGKKKKEAAGKSTVEIVIEALRQAGMFLKDVLSGQWINQISDAFSTLGNFPKQFSDSVTNLGKLFDDFLTSMPEAISNLTEQIPAIFDKIIANMPKIISLIIDGIQKIAELIAAKAPELLAALLKGIAALIRALPDVIRTLAKAIAPMIVELLKALPEIIKAIFVAIPEIVRTLAQNIAPIMKAIALNIGPVIIALVEGLLAAIPEIMVALIDELLINGGLERIIVAILEAIPRIAWALVVGIVQGLMRIVDVLATVIARAFVAAFTSIGNVLANLFTMNIKWPALPKFSWPAMPSFSWPSLPGWNWPSISEPEWLKRLTNIGGGGGGGGTLGQIGKAIGLAHGGIVYAASGFTAKGTDTVPAMLTPGELVVPRKTTANLFSLIDNMSEKMYRNSGSNETSAPINITLKVGEKDLAAVLLNLNRQGFRTT
jgi:hypothetical protein